jgi:hypothetical protein
MYLIGLFLAFVSIFLDWFYFQVYSDKILISSWSYNLFFEWSTIFSKASVLNAAFKPEELAIPFIINLIFFAIILISAYGIVFKDLENEKELTKLYPYSYIQFFLLILNCYYLFVFPVMYLIPNELYFPFLLIESTSDGFIYYYSIGLGYFLQIAVFILIFPYTLLFYQTIVKFEMEEHTPIKIIDRYIRYNQEYVDFDKLIAEEELKQKFHDLDINEFTTQESENITEKRMKA